MTERLYVSVADRYSPLRQATLQGLGSSWPSGRSYWDTSYFRAPYQRGYYGTLQGLGSSPSVPPRECANGSGAWLPLPTPYGWKPVCPNDPEYAMASVYNMFKSGYGAVPGNLPAAIDQFAPPDVKRYLLAGEPPSSTTRDLTLPFNQIPRLAYGIIALASVGIAYASYKRHKKAQKAGTGEAK